MFICALGLAFGITMLFLAMRPIMAVGGFVARGGPYEIAHPAPDWVWAVPVSIWVLMLSGGVHAGAAARLGRFDLILPGWSALFILLGYNFLDFGLKPPGGGVALAWLLCAAVFFVMGAAPLPRFLPARIRERGYPTLMTHWTTPPLAVDPADGPAERRWRRAYGATHLVAIPTGVVSALLAFRVMAG